jgi:hypothetical protein
MRTKNFPEKKRQRQLGALERLENGNPTFKDAKRQIRVLKERTAGGSRRDVRTKIRRGNT